MLDYYHGNSTVDEHEIAEKMRDLGRCAEAIGFGIRSTLLHYTASLFEYGDSISIQETIAFIAAIETPCAASPEASQ